MRSPPGSALLETQSAHGFLSHVNLGTSVCEPKAARLPVSAWQRPAFLLCPHALGRGWRPGVIQSAETSCLVPWGRLGMRGDPRASGEPGACWEDCPLTPMLARLVP